jgi:hypothetical protein
MFSIENPIPLLIPLKRNQRVDGEQTAEPGDDEKDEGGQGTERLDSRSWWLTLNIK